MVVVAAVIERNGRILICQRRRGSKHALKWEFPGGKVEPGEESPEALVRELREELAIESSAGPLMHVETFRYGSSPELRLEFYHVTEFSGEPQNLEFEQIVWVERRALEGYDFLEGDRNFIKKLASE
jgi:8-oxo-dGTP diphosphatase